MKYLVPFDFTPVTRSALDHALEITKSIPGKVELLHIISNDLERHDAEQKFKELVAGLDADMQDRIETKVRVGDIFKDISKEAEEGDAQLLIMGTHGAKGLQKVLGSHAIKVITSSNTPFIVTQSRGPSRAIGTIVLPVDLSKESVQIVKVASELATKFKADVHLVYSPEKDEWLAKKVKTNMLSAKSFLEKAKVVHQVNELQGKHSFDKEVIDYGAEHNADLFAIAHFSESILPQFDKFSQNMITNRLEIPVLVINAHQTSGINSNFAFITV
jgi:nucleotide-binding universal stress UspA family protein